MKDPEVLYTYFEECKLRPVSPQHPVLCSIDLIRPLPSLLLLRNLDEDAQAQERAQLLSGQLEQTRLDIPFASEKDKKIVQIDHEEGKFVGGGNLGFLRQIYFGRLVSFCLHGFRFSSRHVHSRHEKRCWHSSSLLTHALLDLLQVCEGSARLLIKKFEVKERAFYGNTSMESEMSLLMAGQTLVSSPFRERNDLPLRFDLFADFLPLHKVLGRKVRLRSVCGDGELALYLCALGIDGRRERYRWQANAREG